MSLLIGSRESWLCRKSITDRGEPSMQAQSIAFLGPQKWEQADCNVESQRHGYAVRPMPPRDVLARGGAGILKEQ